MVLDIKRLWRNMRMLASDGHYPPDDDFWYKPTGGGGSTAGMPVDSDSALQVSAVYGAVNVISQTMGTTPLLVYEKQDRLRERATGSVWYDRLRLSPNSRQSAFQFRQMLQGHILLRGNAYAELVGDELWPRHPDRVRAGALDDEGYPTSWLVRRRDSTERAVDRRAMLHIPGLVLAGWQGITPIEAERQTLGIALALNEYAGQFFGNGARPGGLLKAPPGTKFTPQQREQIKTEWNAAHQGAQRAHKVAVIEGLEWQQLGITSEDAQFLQSRQFQTLEICRIFRVPPHKLQEYGRATWGNAEQMAIEFYTDTMLPWFTQWEQALMRFLALPDEGLFCEHLVEWMLRGDTATRFEAYSKAINAGWLTRNEVRERENLNPIEGLDEPLQPTNMSVPGQDPPAPSSPTRKPPADDDEADEDGDQATRVWQAWSRAIARAVANAEARELRRHEGLKARNQAGYMDAVRGFYCTTHREYVLAKFGEAAEAWRATLPITATVALVVDSGLAWAAGGCEGDRAASIESLLTSGGIHATAA